MSSYPKKKFSKHEALKEISDGFAFTVIDNAKDYELDKEILLRLLEDENNAIFLIEILDEFNCKKGDDIAHALIQFGESFGVAENLQKFSELNVSVAYSLIDAGVESQGSLIASKLDNFNGEKSTKLALTIINSDEEFGLYDVANNLDKFKNLSKEVYDKVSVHDEYATDAILNMRSFSIEAQYEIAKDLGWTYSIKEKRHYTREEYIESLIAEQKESQQKNTGWSSANSKYETSSDNTNRKAGSAHSTDHIHGETFYEILGVASTSTLSEIKNAYRKLIAIYHPDKGGDEVAAKLINEAYSTLSNKEKRVVYDLQFSYTTSNDFDKKVESDHEDVSKSNYKSSSTTHNPYTQKDKKGWNPDIVAGSIWLGIGLLITFGTLASASDAGGHYVISFGPIIYGIYRLITAGVTDK